MALTTDSFNECSPQRHPESGNNTSYELTSPAENAGDFYNTPTQLVHGKVFVDGEPTRFTGEFPLEPVLPDINVITPGFGGFKRTSRALRHEQASQGLGSVSYDPFRADHRSRKERLTNPQQLHFDTLTAIFKELCENQKVQTNIPNADEFDFERYVLEPHSMGGLPAMRFAAERPDMVKGVMGLATVGYGSPTPFQLAKSATRGGTAAIKKELIPYVLKGDIERTPQNLLRILHYYGRNPLRTFGEMVSCLDEQLHDHASEARRLGVFTAYLAFEHDILVPETSSVADHVDLYQVMPNTGHVAPQAKAAKVAQWVIMTQQDLRTSLKSV